MANKLPVYDFWKGISITPSNSNGIRFDLVEDDTGYIVTAHTPGVLKEDIVITFANDVLTISTTYNSNSITNDNIHHFKECIKKSSQRSIKFQYGKINPSAINATYNNGELKIKLGVLQISDSEKYHQIKID